ncbi:MFS general substrate transporter [Gonapodya prolifera JEL478]|uniref:MFS general substrate transporter n=1 Tax=Gonapodya prolifera (strain JEL478) TaxID=1344416 RepID=A0A138ZWZ8_GONPJ|nr:MFS general substrate transporter [Gonapodya prolifera JEL478]|eukprot:KXS09039.1 MFS general substrate transporter [Gonapodya prolifera JEL478]
MAGLIWPNPNRKIAPEESFIPTGDWTKEEERALVRKLDKRILLMFIGYLDRQNVANAKVLNVGQPDQIEAYLGLKGSQWNLVISIYGIGLFLCEPFSNFLLKKFSAPVWFARIMITWGIITMVTVTNFAGMMTCRFFLGVAESGLLPGVPYYLSFWYTQGERGFRMGSSYTGLGAAGMVSGFIAIGTQNMNNTGGLKSWQWLFILEGIPAILFGFVVFYALPMFPQQHKGFLTPREEEIAIRRLPPNAPSAVDKINRDDIITELKDPVLWLFACGMLFIVIPIAGAAALLPAILVGIGFTTSIQANAMAAVINGWAVFYTFFNGWHSDWTGERYWHIIFTVVFYATVGSFPLALTASNPTWVVPGVRLLFLLLASCISSSYPLVWAYRANTAKGTGRSTVNSALTLTMYAGGLVIGPQIFPSSDAPNYVAGMWASLGLYAAGVACFSLIPFVLRRQLRNEPVPTLSDTEKKALSEGTGTEQV